MPKRATVAGWVILGLCVGAVLDVRRPVSAQNNPLWETNGHLGAIRSGVEQMGSAVIQLDTDILLSAKVLKDIHTANLDAVEKLVDLGNQIVVLRGEIQALRSDLVASAASRKGRAPAR
jgi:hypothetical protein